MYTAEINIEADTKHKLRLGVESLVENFEADVVPQQQTLVHPGLTVEYAAEEHPRWPELEE